jgi:hypothetical protein
VETFVVGQNVRFVPFCCHSLPFPRP